MNEIMNFRINGVPLYAWLVILAMCAAPFAVGYGIKILAFLPWWFLLRKDFGFMEFWKVFYHYDDYQVEIAEKEDTSCQPAK